MLSAASCWIYESDPSVIDCLCLGTGRFLRAVLVPALVGIGYHPALIQPRGNSFVSYVRDEKGTYPVDTVTQTGEFETVRISCYGAFAMGSDAGKQTLFDLFPKMKGISIVGVGVTEAGLASCETQAMKDLFHLLQLAHELRANGTWKKDQKLIVLDMDNVPNNGDVIRQHMIKLAKSQVDTSSDMSDFLTNQVAFLNTMVDRITSQRPNSGGMVPQCEPLPAKALVICDDDSSLPSLILKNQSMLKKDFGVVIRTTSIELQNDIALKLRVANGTHTALAHVMALCRLFNTDVLSSSSSAAADLLLQYVDSLVDNQILPAANILLSRSSPDATTAVAESDNGNEALATWLDWRKRLVHPHFGLSTLFITQNGAQKGGIRLGPTILSLVEHQLHSSLSFHDNTSLITVAMCFAMAALLRFLTPISNQTSNKTEKTALYQGWFDGTDDKNTFTLLNDATEKSVYADGLGYNEQCYEFRCPCVVSKGGRDINLSDWLAQITSPHPQQPPAYWNVVRAYLTSSEGGSMASMPTKQMELLVRAIATLYARMIVGDGLINLLQEIVSNTALFPNGLATPCTVLTGSYNDVEGHLNYSPSAIPDDSRLMKLKVVRASSDFDIENSNIVNAIVATEVQGALVIDLHTHLLPPTHGALCLWGIDELLTYHYLVAEYFMTAPSSVKPEEFYSLNKQEQADLIWKSLFLERSPISEACRGVLTTLCALGLDKEVDARDLKAIRKYYSTLRDKPDGAEKFSEAVFTKSGVKYAIMTNIPFDETEAQYWRPKPTGFSTRYRSALRVDPLLSGDRATVETALKASGYDVTLEGACQYLRDWCDVMQPEYMMASTPHNFIVPEGSIAGVKKTGVNQEAMKQPFAFVEISRMSQSQCDSSEDEVPSVIDEHSDFLSQVLMRVCEERNLPLALKIGAHRGVNPTLGAAGDGVVAFADSGMLGRLCSRFPRVRFLATFLSRNNQHEACVLASKFRNLHLYGCWWFCNNPSIIEEITKMRVEMLGTAFTAQHSDARVLDQLVYKWSHSRDVISKVLQKEYRKLIGSGWTPTRAEIRRDVNRLLGGSYDEFMNKTF